MAALSTWVVVGDVGGGGTSSMHVVVGACIIDVGGGNIGGWPKGWVAASLMNVVVVDVGGRCP